METIMWSPERACPICERLWENHNDKERNTCEPLILQRLQAKGIDLFA